MAGLFDDAASTYNNEGECHTIETLREVEQIIIERDGHGDPHEIHESIAQAWSWYLDEDVDGSDVAMLMVLLKFARAKDGNDANRDDTLDAVGYSAIAASLGDIE